MPLRPCLDCGKLSPNTRCDIHGDIKRRASNARYRPHGDRRRPDYDAAERKRRAQTVAAWRAVHGELCPGWERPPHMATPTNPLTADHITSVRSGGDERGPHAVLCRSCNSRKGSHGVTGDGG